MSTECASPRIAPAGRFRRHDRPSLSDQLADRPEPLLPRRWRYEVADGHEVEPLDLTALPAIDPAVDAMAVCLLHANLNPAREQQVAAALRDQGLDSLPSADRRIAGEVHGSHVLAEPDCTIWIPHGWVATEGAANTLILHRST